MLKKNAILVLAIVGCLCACDRGPAKLTSLVPGIPSAAPDYFCTWNVQGFISGWETPRQPMNEEYLFGDGLYQNWTGFFPGFREDLYFVMDDSWDIPLAEERDSPSFGTTMLDTTRFPSFRGDPAGRLKMLADSIKARGWKGAGGWIHAGKPAAFADITEEEFWTERLKESEHAGFDYWKVDWGPRSHDGQWRRMLTGLGHQYAPDLWIEHASPFNVGEPFPHKEFIEFSDVFRTYDVEPNTAQALTIQRIVEVLPYKAEEGAKGIINCEDEPYIAVGLGCAIGVMRHEFRGGYPNGIPDYPFHESGRNVKGRIDEIARGVRWHRIAEPFGVDGTYEADPVMLEDYWYLREYETWVTSYAPGDTVRFSAPARVSRGMPLPELSDSDAPDRPFILASRYPNGAVALAAISRTMGRSIAGKELDATIKMDDPAAPIGIFGRFSEVNIEFPENIDWKKVSIHAQDLAGDTPVDITAEVTAEGNRLTIPGSVINRVGLMAASEGDISDPGMVVQIKR